MSDKGQTETRSLGLSAEEQADLRAEELRLHRDVLCRNIEELQSQYRELEEKNLRLENARRVIEHKVRELEAAREHRSRFLASVSHELRSPLSSILILARLLRENADGAMGPRQVEYAHAISSAGNDLLAMIDDLLDHTRIEVGRFQLTVGRCDIRELVEAVALQYGPVARAKGLSFGVRVSDGLPEEIFTDRQRVEQILKNLVFNAIKFTEQGGITLTLSDEVGDQSGFMFSVEDTGVGIPSTEQAQIFEAFYQIRSEGRRTQRGVGLGLTISRELTHLLGGEICLRSVEGEGSVFTLWLPERVPERVLVNQRLPVPSRQLLGVEEVRDDRREIFPGDRVVLIATRDPAWARRVLAVGRRLKFKGVIAHDPEAVRYLVRLHPPVLAFADEVLVTATRRVLAGGDVSVWQLDGKALAEAPDLPVAEGEETLVTAFEEAVRAPCEVVQSRPLDGRTVLLVEDDIRQLFALTSLLEEYGAEVVAARDGQECLERLDHSDKVDLIVTDVMMPGIDGTTAIARIRAREARARLPIIAMSADAVQGERQRCIEAGADDFIAKPVDPARLLAMAQAWLPG